MAKRRKQPKSDSNDISVGNISNVNGSVINIGNGNVNDGDISPQLNAPLPRNGDEIRPSENKGQKKDNRTTIIVAVIGGLAVCIAAIISLGEPLVAKIVEIYFPGPTHTPTIVTYPQSLESTPTPKTFVTPTVTPSNTPQITPTPTLTAYPTSTPDPDVLPACLEVGQTWTSPVDKMKMVCVPKGGFLMGSNDEDRSAKDNEKPQHTVYLDAYWIDQTEVTNAQYAQCVESGACSLSGRSASQSFPDYYGNQLYDNYPAIFVTFQDAVDYCTWAERTLPTEAQWEKAARGTDGRIFPWGNNQPDNTRLNYSRYLGDVTAVGSYPSGISPYGALDMAGNALEWTTDRYHQDYYSLYTSWLNPQGPKSGDYRVQRGGCWDSGPWSVRTTMRVPSSPNFRALFVGFRCALADSPSK